MNDIEDLLRDECTSNELNIILDLIKLAENTPDNKLKEKIKNKIDSVIQ